MHRGNSPTFLLRFCYASATLLLRFCYACPGILQFTTKLLRRFSINTTILQRRGLGGTMGSPRGGLGGVSEAETMGSPHSPTKYRRMLVYIQYNFESMFDSITNIDNAKHFYIGTMSLIHILYFAAFIGIYTVDQIYVNYLNVFIQTFIVLFLTIRFHPFRTRHSITSADATIVFGSAVLLGTNLLTVEFAKWIPFTYETRSSFLREYRNLLRNSFVVSP